MSQNIHNITSLNWQSLVTEAIRRRKDLNLNQKEHAALAGVSVPTMFSFEKYETTISLAKALDILNVVGLVIKQNEITDPLSKFAEAAEAKWFALIQDLPKDSPARHPYGYYTYTYEITDNSGASKAISLSNLMGYLKESQKINHSGWAPFWLPTRDEIKPYIDNDTIECWHKNSDVFNDVGHSDFWQTKPMDSSKLLMHLHRGYREDDEHNPGTAFNIDRPIINAGEIILHAVHIANLVTKNSDDVTIKLKVKYHGLRNRELFSIPNTVYNRKICKQDSVDLSIEFKASDINELPEQNDNLTEIVHSLLTDLYSRFDFFKISLEGVDQRLVQMRKNRY